MNTIDGTEDVVRILANEWVIDGVLQQTAFTLREGETYISVNRPALSSFHSDIISFVRSHKHYHTQVQGRFTYQQASLNVGDIRNIVVLNGNTPLSINVEVEPRDVFTKSHAGIFTRYGNKIVKIPSVNLIKEMSADMVLLKVRLSLLRLATTSINKLNI